MSNDKEWLKEKVLGIGTNYPGKVYTWRVLELVAQLDPVIKKPVIPQFIADDINLCQVQGVPLIDALNSSEGKLKKWIKNNSSEKYASAWLAYPNVDIEEEKIFRVKVGEKLYFVRYEDDCPIFVIDDAPGKSNLAHHFDFEDYAKECAEELGGTYEEVPND